MDTLKQLRSLCTHTSHSVVHPVDGGHRAHCLKCGMVGPLRKDRKEARWAIWCPGPRAQHYCRNVPR
jgi:hypothetical protein